MRPFFKNWEPGEETPHSRGALGGHLEKAEQQHGARYVTCLPLPGGGQAWEQGCQRLWASWAWLQGLIHSLFREVMRAHLQRPG